MFMKLLIKFLFFLLILFFLNVIFYFLSDDYKFFLQNLKHNWDIINQENKENKNILDNNNNDDILDKNLNSNLNSNNNNLNNDDILKIDNNNFNLVDKSEPKNNEIKQEVILWSNYRKVLDLFKTNYELKEIEINWTLFELTDEYPDHYYEYYSKELTIYLFTTKTYSQVFEMFNYLQSSLPFSVKELNNFWEKSFYINMRDDVKDNYIRLVISKNGINFWLKIRNDEYNKVKEILLKL